MLRTVATGVLLQMLLALSACSRLAPGNVGCARVARPPEIYLVRGYLDWYSAGIDSLATELKSAGNNAVVYREEQWGDLADSISAGPRHHPLVLIGFSYGADDVILIARRLADCGVAVDLLITLDPVTPANVPANVRRCVNFFEPNGFWDLLPFLRGVPLSADTGAPSPQNIDVKSRSDLDEPEMSHSTIASDEKLHQAIISLVQSIRSSGRW